MAKRPFDFSKSGQVFLVNDQAKLDWYNQHFNPSYIQEYVGVGQELRLIVLNYHTLFAYRRKGAPGLSKAGPYHSEVCRLDKISPNAVELAKKVAWDADLSDVTIDMIYDGSGYRVLDLSCQCCEEGWFQAGRGVSGACVQGRQIHRYHPLGSHQSRFRRTPLDLYHIE